METSNFKFSPGKFTCILKNKGMKKKQVAELAGFKAPELSRYLGGQTEPMGPRLEALAKALDVTVEEITEENFFKVYCAVIEIEFTYSGLRSISRDGVLFWTTNIEHIFREKRVRTHTFELPDSFAPELLGYIAEGLNRNHPARSKEDKAALKLLTDALIESRQGQNASAVL